MVREDSALILISEIWDSGSVIKSSGAIVIYPAQLSEVASGVSN